jgi:hypothetical protein
MSEPPVGNAAAIGNELEVRAGPLLEEQADDLRGGSQAPGAQSRLVRIGLQPFDQSGKVVRGQIPPGHDQRRIADDLRNRIHGRVDVVRQRQHSAVQHVRRPGAETDRVTVGRGADGPADSDRTRCARDIFDDDRLTQRIAHPLRENAGDRIGGAAGAVGNDDCDRADRKGLRMRNVSRGVARDGPGGKTQKQAAPCETLFPLSHHGRHRQAASFHD